MFYPVIFRSLITLFNKGSVIYTPLELVEHKRYKRTLGVNMKRLSPLLLATATTFFCASAFAGPGASGGGQGIVCRNPDGTVASAKLLDLVEAQDYFLLSLQSQPADRPYMEIAHEYAAILDGAMALVNPIAQTSEQVGNLPPQVGFEVNESLVLSHTDKIQHMISFTLDEMNARKMLIPGDDFAIPPVGDSHPLVLPTQKGCAIEQIALYTDGNDAVHFVGGIWNSLDNVNKAALLIHEILYRRLRGMGDTTSDQTRKANGYLFSGMKFEWVMDGVPQKYRNCWTNDANHSFQFVVYPDEQSSVTLQFLVYDNEVMLTKTATSLSAAFFGGAFGLPMSSPGNEAVINTILNPLLDSPNYEFNITVDPTSGAISSSFEAFAATAGKNPLQISCNDHLSEITYGADGSVSVGPVN
jgi:hypothetical protein